MFLQHELTALVGSAIANLPVDGSKWTNPKLHKGDWLKRYLQIERLHLGRFTLSNYRKLAFIILILGTNFLVSKACSSELEGNKKPIELGGLDLTEYCQEKYGAGQMAIVIPGEPYSWRCWLKNSSNIEGGYPPIAPATTIKPIDMGSACAWQYGQNRKLFALLTNPKDVNYWRCFIRN